MNNVAVFSPHSDDETLGCGATIVGKLRRGSDVFVIVMTDGRHSHDHVLGIDNPPLATVRMIRREEFKAAMRVLGVKRDNTTTLDFEDGKLREHSDEVSGRIKNILLEVKPIEVFTTFKDDGKLDHDVTSRIVFEVLKQESIQSIVYEYPI